MPLISLYTANIYLGNMSGAHDGVPPHVAIRCRVKHTWNLIAGFHPLSCHSCCQKPWQEIKGFAEREDPCRHSLASSDILPCSAFKAEVSELLYDHLNHGCIAQPYIRHQLPMLLADAGDLQHPRRS